MKLLIRADASPQIGTGHVMRCLALAQAWLMKGGQVAFLMSPDAPNLEARLHSEGIQTRTLLAISGSINDAQETVKISQIMQVDWVVLDGYQFDADYQKFLKDADLRLLCLDDYGHAKRYYADFILNQNISACEKIYPYREPYTQLLLGTQYVLLRQEFWSWQGWQRKIPPMARKILVTMGGSDPDNVTLKVLQAFQKVEIEELEVIIIVGSTNPHHEKLQEVVQSISANIMLQQNVINMPELMAWADIAIAGGGSTCWELAFMGLPALLIVLANNQQNVVQILGENNFVQNLGWHENIQTDALSDLCSQLIISVDTRIHFSHQGRKLIDGCGKNRVIDKLINKKFL
jgi:UDP-2,4-diacetamido-2,4,6-trideoxy-beta-L-altropyranose hydrolase